MNLGAPAGIDVLLVGPDGQNAVVMSDAGGYTAITNVNLVLDDAATDPLPGDPGPIVSGTFRPTNINDHTCLNPPVTDPFPSPAPFSTGASALSVFNGTNPNGAWSLYVVDDTCCAAGGSFSAGWSMTITTDNCAGPTPTPPPTPIPGVVHFAVAAPGCVYQGYSFQFTVTALDRFNNIVTNYPGMVYFTSSDPFGASLPADSRLTNGTGIFSARSLAFMFSVTITATDTSNLSITGISNCIFVGKQIHTTATATPTSTPPPPPTPTPTPTPTATETPSPTLTPGGSAQALNLSTRLLVDRAMT